MAESKLKKSRRSGKIKKEKKVPAKSKTRKKVVVKKRVAAKKVVIKKSALALKKSRNNPVIVPESNNSWESKAAFNPSAIYHDGKVHVVYRAIGESDISVLGYAKSEDGYFFDSHSKKLAYYRRDMPDVSLPNISYVSGGGWGGGSEDPRLTKIGERIYMIYTAFDGWGSLRIALTSISLADFISGRFNWREAVLMSPPGEIHKNWVLFPEKINGKYAILHSFAPKILIDYFESLDELDGKSFIQSNNTRPVDESRTWDSWFRGVGPTPIKTKYGWLLIYHGMDHKNPDRYRMGAIILDLQDPTKILYRSQEPILEPEEWYENNGYKSGVVYACGAVVKDGKLFVYYGGADKVSCLATADLDKFLKELMRTGKTKLKK